jgi:aryl-alcohol dehydrogenase-like predicted oxidoreductase
VEKTSIRPRLDVGTLGYGAMSLTDVYGEIDDDDALAVLSAAVDSGMTFVDTANIYGDGRSETIIGRFIAERGRDGITLASKTGIVRDGPARGIRGDGPYIREQIELSLQRLGTDHLDLYYQHRIDPKVPVEETVGALAELVAEGKVRHIGLSEATGEELRRASSVHPIAAVQSEWSLFSRDIEVHVIPAAAELGITVVAFSPLSRGLLTDDFDPTALVAGDLRLTMPRFQTENLPANVALAREVTDVAQRHGVRTEEVALAWVGAKAQQLGVHASAIPGTRSFEHLRRNIASVRVQLDADDIRRLDTLADRVQGARAADSQWVSGGREGLI